MKNSLAEKTQSIASNTLTSVGTILKILLRSKYSVQLPKTTKTDCIIMGNGPSMKNVVAAHHLQLKNKVLWAVNYFGNTELFEQVKPSYYLIVGPEFWREDVREKNKTLRKKLFDNLLSKTNWPLIVFLPAEAFTSTFLKYYLNKNANLRFQPFNTTPIEGFQGLNNLLMKANLGMPRPHNVIIPTLMVALNMGFKSIYLTGVEHSWLPTITVNNKNEVLHLNKHFYDNSHLKNKPMYLLGKRTRKLHEVLHKFMLSFKGYFTIREYADSQGAKIYNTTPGSYIDAFERKMFDEAIL